jgi:hypothetical protein
VTAPWRWTRKDGPPQTVGAYIVALEIGRVRLLWWDGEAWTEGQYHAPYACDVLAWIPLPAFPRDAPP